MTDDDLSSIDQALVRPEVADAADLGSWLNETRQAYGIADEIGTFLAEDATTPPGAGAAFSSTGGIVFAPAPASASTPVSVSVGAPTPASEAITGLGGAAGASAGDGQLRVGGRTFSEDVAERKATGPLASDRAPVREVVPTPMASTILPVPGPQPDPKLQLDREYNQRAISPAGASYRAIPGRAGSRAADTPLNSDLSPALTLSVRIPVRSLNLPASWRDTSGQPISGPDGEELRVPAGFDIQGVLAAAKATPLGDMPAQLSNLMKLGQGHEWDMQRLTGKFDVRYRDSATVLIGAYAAATGMGLHEILAIESAYAGLHSRWADNEPMHDTYRKLPVRNVANTYWGYMLVTTGRLKP